MKNLNHQVIFRVDDSDYALLKSLAKKTGLSQAGYLRQILRGFVPKEKPPPEYYEMVQELRAIRSDISQITDKLRITGEFSSGEYDNTLRILRESILKIVKAVIVPERRK